MAYIKTQTFNDIFGQDADTGKSTFMARLANSIYYQFMIAKFTGIVAYFPFTYALLRARYGNSYIADINSDSFLEKLFAVMFQYTPRWAKNVEIQGKVFSLTEADLMAGSVQKSTHGYNPSTVPGTANDDTSIETVNDQSLVKYTKSKVEGYAHQLGLLDDGITEEYVSRFSKLFMSTIDVDDILEAWSEDDD